MNLGWKGKTMREWSFFRLVGFWLSGFIIFITGAALAEENFYIGSQTCGECHEKEFARYMAHSKKARTYENIKKMQKKLTREEFESCFDCHTTGYGKKCGFVSEEKTPLLKNAGCEVCHGPGGLHAESGDPDLIVKKIPDDLCVRCHDHNRIETFNHEPLTFGGAH